MYIKLFCETFFPETYLKKEIVKEVFYVLEMKKEIHITWYNKIEENKGIYIYISIKRRFNFIYYFKWIKFSTYYSLSLNDHKYCFMFIFIVLLVQWFQSISAVVPNFWIVIHCSVGEIWSLSQKYVFYFTNLNDLTTSTLNNILR